MRRLLKEEFYKSLRGVTFYICLAVSAVLFLLSALIQRDVTHSWQELGFNMFSYASVNDFVVVFCLIFVCAEFSRGTIKNYTAVGVSKGKIFSAKYIKVGICVLCLYVLNMLLSLVLYDYSGSGIDTGMFLYFTFYNFLVILEVVCVGVSLAFLIRNVGGYIGIIFGIEILYGILLGVSDAYAGLGGIGMFYMDVNSISEVTKFLLYLYNILPTWTFYLFALTDVPLYEKIFVMAAPVLVSGIMISWAYLNFKRRDIK